MVTEDGGLLYQLNKREGIPEVPEGAYGRSLEGVTLTKTMLLIYVLHFHFTNTFACLSYTLLKFKSPYRYATTKFSRFYLYEQLNNKVAYLFLIMITLSRANLFIIVFNYFFGQCCSTLVLSQYSDRGEWAFA